MTWENAYYGSMILRNDTSIIIAEENIYRFLGSAYSVLLSEYIHESCKEIFAKHFEQRTAKKDYFVVKCRRYDNYCTDVCICLYTKSIMGIEHTCAEIFDINKMALDFKRCSTENYTEQKMLSLCSENIFFIYKKDSDIIEFYKNGNKISETELKHIFKTKIIQKAIPKSELSKLKLICDAVSDSNCGGAYSIDASLFSEKTEPVFIRFSPVDSNAQTVYTVGYITPKPNAFLSDHDPMTNLLNKKAIREYAEYAMKKALKEKQSLFFFIVDLDNFKKVNDNYGHLQGDKTIMNAARIMRSAVGKKGEVGRIGGDEFLIIVSDIGETAQENVPFLRSLRSSIEFCFKNKFGDVKVTCSVGGAKFLRDADNFDDMYLLADYCLYSAKLNGRNRFSIYYPPTQPTLEEIKNSGLHSYFSDIVTNESKYEHLLSSISLINQVKNNSDVKAVFDKTAKEILLYYSVDAIIYISLTDDKMHIGYSEICEADFCELCKLIRLYSNEISEEICAAFGKPDSAKLNFSEFEDYMIGRNIGSLMLIGDKNENDELTGCFVVFSYQRYKNWSAYDKHILPILCKTLTKLIV